MTKQIVEEEGTNMLGLIAKVTVKANQVDRFWEHLQGDIIGTRKEAGCHRFDVMRDDKAKNVFWLYEVYDDQAAYSAHQASPHFQAFFAQAGDTLDGPPEIHSTQVVSWSDAK